MKRLNFDVDVIESEWGEGVNLDILQQKLQADRSHAVKAVCVVHNETSTGVTNDLGLVRKSLGTLFQSHKLVLHHFCKSAHVCITMLCLPI